MTSLLKSTVMHMFACAVAAAMAVGTVHAQVNQNLMQGMQWRNIGPFIAGKVLSVSGVNGNSAIAYIGTDNGGVWKTLNAGVTWSAMTDAEHAIRGVTALTVAQSQPSVIYIGTGSVFGTHYSSGAWKSTDAGAHWQSAGLKDVGEITWLLVDPHNANLVLASSRGVDHRKGGQRGVFRSTDGGQTWKLVLGAGAESGATYISWANDNTNVIFAVLAQTYAAPGASRPSRSSPPPPTSLYKSTDEGLTWAKVEGRNQPTVTGPIAVANGTQSQRVYMLNRTGLYRSDDGGANWSLGTKTIYTSGRQVIVDPHNPDVLYTMGTTVYRSTDGGHTLVAFKGSPGGDDPIQWWIDPTNPEHIVYGGDQGATVSLDSGHTWSPWYNQATAQIYKISTDNRYPYWIYGSKQDSGAIATASRGPLGQITNLDWFPLPGWETGFVTIDPSDPDVIYENGDFGFLQKVHRGTWRSQFIDPGIGAISAVSDTDYRRAVSTPIVFSPQDTHTLYWATQNVWESHDQGSHWTKISPDLTAHPGKPPLPPPEGLHHGDALESLSPSAVQARVMWTGSNNGVIYVTKDGGKNWQDVTPPKLSIHSIVNIQASSFNPAAAYAAVEDNATGDYMPYIYRTRDYGKSWQSITTGLPTDQLTGSFVRVVREDPKRRGLLFAGTETSVYVSFDDGDHWQSLRLNLPTTSFYDLQIHDHDLIAATYGRAIWILDDISPLEQMSADTATQSVHLFRPLAAIRVQANINQDTPFPPEVPRAKNPPHGAVIDYYLAQPARTVELQILDSTGKLVRTYSSARIPKLDQSAPPAPAFWIRPNLPLPASAGAHRVTWDMRYPMPPALFFSQSMAAVPEETPFVPEGPVALPGNYVVKLIVDGSSHSQPLVLKEDPRIGDSAAAMDTMRKQLLLAQRIITVMTASKDAFEQGKSFSTGLSSLSMSATDGPAKALREDVAKLTGTLAEASIGLSGGNYAVPPVKGVTNFSRINGQSSNLLYMVTGYSNAAAPVSSQQNTYLQLCKDFNNTAEALRSLQPVVGKLDARLKLAGTGQLPKLKRVAPLACEAAPATATD